MKTCPHCKKEYDAGKYAHLPIESEESRSMMTIRFVTGCKEIEREAKS